MTINHAEIEKFLYHEARLADEHRYDEWEKLWTDDAVYWVPCNDDDSDPELHVSIIYDDREGIAARLKRLKSGAAWAQEPKSRIRRVISNVEVQEERRDEIVVQSNFIIGELRRGEQNLWIGRTVHKLRRENGDIKIAYKKVMLLNNDTEMPNLWILV
jgi:3-phenylpropionate/cinnamic acid dioxygenase small subunit